jgi:hypothetical protein
VTQRALSLAIVGIDYPNKRGPGRRVELEICQPGEPIELRPEPNNQFDEHAVAVFSCRGIQLDYLAANSAVSRAPLSLRRNSHVLRVIIGNLFALIDVRHRPPPFLRRDPKELLDTIE